MKNIELPAGKAAMAWHIGPYEQPRAAHESLAGYVAAHGLRPPAAPGRSTGRTRGWPPDPAKWRTQQLVAVEP